MKLSKELLNALLGYEKSRWWLRTIGEDFPINKLQEIKGDYRDIVNRVKTILEDSIFELNNYTLVFKDANEELYKNKYDEDWNLIESNYKNREELYEYDENIKIIRCDYNKYSYIPKIHTKEKKWYNIFSNKKSLSEDVVNYHNNITPKEGYQQAYIMEYNKDGFLISKKYSNGEYEKYIRNEDGALVLLEYYKDDICVKSDKWYLNSDGLIETAILSNCNIIQEVTYHNNKKAKNFRTNKGIFALYDDKERLIHSVTKRHIKEYRYDDKDNLIYLRVNDSIYAYDYIYGDNYIQIKSNWINTKTKNTKKENCIIPTDYKTSK